jgi:hypothetical protein
MFSVGAGCDEQLSGEVGTREAGSGTREAGRGEVAVMEAAAAPARRKGAIFIK